MTALPIISVDRILLELLVLFICFYNSSTNLFLLGAQAVVGVPLLQSVEGHVIIDRSSLKYSCFILSSKTVWEVGGMLLLPTLQLENSGMQNFTSCPRPRPPTVQKL